LGLLDDLPSLSNVLKSFKDLSELFYSPKNRRIQNLFQQDYSKYVLDWLLGSLLGYLLSLSGVPPNIFSPLLFGLPRGSDILDSINQNLLRF
jgi:hypothetical protein